MKNISKLENVQRKDTRFVKQDYSKYNSLTSLIHELDWKILQDRKK